MKPIIALVGRPNVGKSTLFNKLTRTQDALVADFPGLTRDRQYGDGRVGGFGYTVIDTGGLSGAPQTLDAAMADQTLIAVSEADLIVFLVDGRSGLLGVDQDIAEELRRRSSRVLLCVNKIDGVGEDKAQLDFYALGFEHTEAIAASQNRGIHQLMQKAAGMLGVKLADEEGSGSRRRRRKRHEPVDPSEFDEAAGEHGGIRGADPSVTGAGTNADARIDTAAAAGADAAIADDRQARRDEIRICFVGRPNVGKSTLINRLIGEDRVIAYDKPGTTRDAVAIPFSRGEKQYKLIDTAGVRRRGKVSEKVEIFSIIKTLKAIEESNVCVMLLDASDSVTDQDLHLLGHIIEKGRALIVAVNKWDALSAEKREDVRADLERRVEFLRFTRIHFISALQGSGVGDLFKSVHKAHHSAFIDLSTSKLTRLLEVGVSQHQPPMVNGRRIKLRYAHQGGVNPPIIVVHGNQSSKVPASYQRYLMNHFMKVLRLFGTPLRVEFKQGDNPYAARSAKIVRKPGQGRGEAGRRGEAGKRGEASKRGVRR